MIKVRSFEELFKQPVGSSFSVVFCHGQCYCNENKFTIESKDEWHLGGIVASGILDRLPVTLRFVNEDTKLLDRLFYGFIFEGETLEEPDKQGLFKSQNKANLS